MLRSIQTRSGASQPVVFVLPGIMGSELQADGKDVWMSYWSLLRGHIDKIAIDAPKVTVTGLVSSYYRALCDYLADSHEVISGSDTIGVTRSKMPLPNLPTR